MLNVVVLQGRLAADPQLRQTTTGKNVASFRIGCDRGRKDANGLMWSRGIVSPNLSAGISRRAA